MATMTTPNTTLGNTSSLNTAETRRNSGRVAAWIIGVLVVLAIIAVFSMRGRENTVETAPTGTVTAPATTTAPGAVADPNATNYDSTTAPGEASTGTPATGTENR